MLLVGPVVVALQDVSLFAGFQIACEFGEGDVEVLVVEVAVEAVVDEEVAWVGFLAEFGQGQRSVVIFDLFLELLGHPSEADDQGSLEFPQGVAFGVGVVVGGREGCEDEVAVLAVFLPGNDEPGGTEVPIDFNLAALPLLELELPGERPGLCVTLRLYLSD